MNTGVKATPWRKHKPGTLAHADAYLQYVQARADEQFGQGEFSQVEDVVRDVVARFARQALRKYRRYLMQRLRTFETRVLLGYAREVGMSMRTGRLSEARRDALSAKERGSRLMYELWIGDEPSGTYRPLNFSDVTRLFAQIRLLSESAVVLYTAYLIEKAPRDERG